MEMLKWVLTQIHPYDIWLALLGLFLFMSIHEWLTNKGPMRWPILGIIPSFALNYRQVHDWNTKALKKSGGTYKIKGFLGGFEGIMTADPLVIQYILKTKFKNFPKGKYYRERFRDLLGDGIFNSDDEKWKEQRRIATSEMHTARFLHYSLATMQTLLHDKLLKVIEKQVKTPKSQPIDLQELLLRFTFDNVCMAAFGVDPGCLALDLPDVPFAKAFEDATEYSLFRFLVPPFVWKPMRFLNVSKERRLKQALKTVHEFAQTTVKNRKADLTKVNRDQRWIQDSDNGIFKPPKLLPNYGKDHDPSDLLSRLILTQGNGDVDGFSDKFLSDFCISFILAGRDTSSVALVWFFWLVHENPHVENMILLEIKDILSQRKGVDLKDLVFDSHELEKMSYLHAALSEALRLYPSVPVDFKQAREDEVLPCGTTVRRGRRVLYHVYAMGRMESIWGKDCFEFKPERWLNKEGKFVSESQFKYVVFNAGPRLCVGKKFAYMQMKMVAASVLMRYKVVLKKGHVVAPKVTTTLYMKYGLLVDFKPRSFDLS